ncbi:hypothetical protein [Falsirhodobacter halotolerans]|uniref:hypothetical protein n=1 Tax=Falsirhodobacter halotolerans TaxID=1146892 RepID=UPI001FD1C80F|nr:hypothetical protein [Falsirhodobacter halotolerans]MCJ8138438.1 hypothetical protein [Falsirhodobacter halotolerans]
MRPTSPALTAHRNQRSSVHAEHLVWIAARNREDNSIETVGLWTGSGQRSFTVDNVVRRFNGGCIADLSALHDEAGIRVRRKTLTLAGTAASTETALRIYDTYNAPVTIWRAEFNADKNLLAAPERVWRGVVEAAPFTTAAITDDGVALCTVDLTLISDAWRLTVMPPLTKAAATQGLRNGDQGRRYSNVHDATVQWGETQQAPKKRKKFLGIF